MKKFICLLLLVCLCGLFGCKDDEKTITVCASELPHADILENCVKGILEEKGYKLEVKVLDWTLQNDGVASGDYDANYFQHVPYLETYTGSTKLFASCKVHYEPLSIYYGKKNIELSEGKTFEICNDESNAVRAFKLLKEKGVLTEIPVDENDKLTFEGSSYTADNGVTVTLISEDLLVSSINDYDFALLPCNTAYTGNVDSARLVAKEDSEELVYQNANIIAAREDDYKNNETYRNKIDVLTDALLSEEVRNYVSQKYAGKIICDASSQIDLRK